MKKLSVPGVAIDGARTGAFGDGEGSMQPFASIQVSSQRNPLPGLQEVEVPDDHVIEVTLEEGIVLYRRAEALTERNRSRGGASNTLPVALTAPTGTRGGGRYFVRLYRFFKGDAVTEAAVDAATSKIEGKLVAPDLLMRCRTPANLDEAGSLPEGHRMLVLLHGTFSSTVGSFGNLVPQGGTAFSGPWHQLVNAYSGTDRASTELFAFEHRTLSKSPLENAIDLVDQLPRGAQIDLLSHSRGGLVGELLCRAARSGRTAGDEIFDATDRDILKAKHSGETLERLLFQIAELDRKLDEKDLQIGSFVRVACPMRGTLLASERLDLYLSVFLNLLSLAPGPQQVFVSAVSEFVRAVVGSRKDVMSLPGLEAMMPSAAHIAMLNRQDIILDTALDIIGGDIEAGGVLRALAIFATDLFYREDHDLVVNTSAMFGGAPRTTQNRALISRGSNVAHFNYFRNGDSLDRIVGALADPPDRITRSAPPTLSSVLRGSRDTADKPSAIIVPGIMGSTLTKGSDLIWVDPIDLMRGGIREIGADATGVPAPGVRATGVVERYYIDLAQHIATTHRTVIRQYDWRLSIDRAADLLQAAIEDALDATESTKQPVRLICHSMGGLVARRMMVKHRATWERMHAGRTGSRVLMLGTPNGGSASMAAGLLGRDRMIRQLALVDFKSSLQEILASIIPLPGILELLPTDEDYRYFDERTWHAFATAAPRNWQPPSQEALTSAKETWDSMALNPGDARHILYIAGQAPATVTMIRSEPTFALLATPNGDGRVTWATGIPAGVATWYAPGVEHGDLARDRRLFQPVMDLLVRGTTERLTQNPPVSRDADTIFELKEEPVIYPSGGDLDLLPMGGTPDTELIEQSKTPRARITIEHGDLRLQPGAVLVGHYDGAPLIATEKALNDILGDSLRMHRNAGIYPGAIGSSELFFGTDGSHFGPDTALVVGLGRFGFLTPQDLKRTLIQGLIRFALRLPSAPDRERSLTSLLVGHLDNRISIRESVRALLEALETANRQVPERMRIDRLRILELFEDRAIEASEALAAAEDVGRFSTLAIDWKLKDGRGGRKRQSFGRDAEWEMIIEVTCPADKPECLRFRVMNRSALVDTDETDVNRHVVDHLLKGVQTTGRTDTNIGRLLFRRLVPRSVRRVLSEGSNVTLVLDEIAAAYPWELSVDRVLEKPIAVRTKMVRQLIQNLRPDRPRPPSTELSLVIGDPKSCYAPLPEALKEAQSVEARLKSSSIGEVVACYGDDPTIEEKVFLTEARRLHFAGHGIVNGGPDHDITGLVIGRDSYLTANDIRQMETVPEFVFLNCCHVARIAPSGEAAGGGKPSDSEVFADRADLAANIAVAFMKQGSKAVIAAGWAIDDKNAKIFSDTFYDRFLAGDTFSEAVQAARDETHEQSRQPSRQQEGGNIETSEPTWGAYQCYGDSQFRLRTLAGLQPRPSDPPIYAARSQVLAALHMVRMDARFVRNKVDADKLLDTLEHLEEAVQKQPAWARSPEVLEGLGRALFEIGRRDQAIRYLDEAARASPPTVSIETLELRDMLRVRQASEARWLGRDSENAKELVKAEQAQHELAIQSLRQHENYAFAENGQSSPSRGSTTRLLRLGDTHLRFAAALASQRGKKLYLRELNEAVSCYSAAEDQIGGEDVLELAYARLRRTAAKYFLIREEKGSGLDMMREVDSVIASLRAEREARPLFERELRLAEAQLLLFLVERGSNAVSTKDSHVAETVDMFARAFLAGATVGQREETIDDLEVLARLLDRIETNSKASLQVRIVASELKNRSLVPAYPGSA
jgi:tetratricopeptide (TPR) repeat protein/pimeloyl-ACP methyl ester carboxylesterase